MPRPDILILMPDQFRADTMGCAGHPQVRTPHIDRIAREGMRFTEAATVSPICMPARASFISGLYPHNHGMWTNRGELPAGDETFFQHLQRAGYFTAHIGKSHYYPHGDEHLREREPYMHARGFEYVHETTGPHATVRTRSRMTDDWDAKGLYEKFRADYSERAQHHGAMVRPSPLPFDDFLDSYVGRQAVEFVDRYEDERPMCLFVGFGGPHEPWDAPEPYASMYDPLRTPPAIPIPPWARSVPRWMAAHRVFEDFGEKVTSQTASIRANYYGKISLIDEWIGRILAAFERRGRLSDLLIVFWSDHGEMAGDHGRIHKATFHESSVRVPLLVRWPGRVPAGTTSSALAETVDIFPTVLEAAGCQPSSRCLGRSLWPVLRDPQASLRPWQLSEILHGEGRVFMLRSASRKYAVDQQGRGFMLYDLESDPTEQCNLILEGGVHGLESCLRDALLGRLLEAQYSMK